MSVAIITSLDSYKDGRLEIQFVVTDSNSKSEGNVIADAGTNLESLKAQIRNLEKRNIDVKTLRDSLSIGQELDLTPIPPSDKELIQIEFNKDLGRLRKLNSFVELGLVIQTDRNALFNKIQNTLSKNVEFED